MEYTDPIIEKCRFLSEHINAYFDEKRYIAIVDQIEQVTPQFLRDLAIELLLDELSILGIISNFTPPDLITSAIDLETAFYLRSKFDGTNFYKTLKQLDEATYSDFCGIHENIGLAEDMLREFAEYFSNKFPLDIGWQYIVRSMDHWVSTEAFVAHIDAICNKLDQNTDNNKTHITDSNINEIANFLNHMVEREKEITLYLYDLIKRDSINSIYKLDFSNIKLMIKKYDHEKLHPDIVESFANYEKHHPEEEPDYVRYHHLTVNHHYEYWKLRNINSANTETMSLEVAVMYLYSLILDRLPISKIKEEITKLSKLTHVVSPNVISFLNELVELDYDAIRKGEITNEVE